MNCNLNNNHYMTIKEPFMFLPEIIQFELPRILKLFMELILCNGAVPGCISTIRAANTDMAFNDLIMRSKQCISSMLP